MNLSERFSTRIVEVELTTVDGVQERIHLQTLSYFDWQDVGFAAPFPDKDEFMRTEKVLEANKPVNKTTLDDLAYRRALNTFHETVALYRLGVALAGGGDAPEFVDMKYAERAALLLTWDKAIIDGLLEALEGIIKGESQIAKNGTSFPRIPDEGADDLPSNGRNTGKVVKSDSG